MGYADQGEEEDWTRPDHSPEHAVAKSKKPGKPGEKRTWFLGTASSSELAQAAPT